VAANQKSFPGIPVWNAAGLRLKPVAWPHKTVEWLFQTTAPQGVNVARCSLLGSAYRNGIRDLIPNLWWMARAQRGAAAIRPPA